MTICIFVLLLAGLLIAAQKALSTDGAVQIVVTVDGKSYGTYSLKREQVIRIETEYGYNELTIKDGKAGVTASDCKNQVCVHSMAISQNGQSIICLPHKLIIQITGSGKKQLDAMKPTAFLINSGRAALVDQEALVEALKNHTIGGAAVDVFTNEPATGDPLMDPALTNVLVTPHVGIYTEETLREIDILAMENLVSHL